MARVRNSHVLLVIALLFACLAAGQEIKRPTADMDGGNNTKLGCVGQNQASTAMPNAYDAAGLSTSSNQLTLGGLHQTKFETRIFMTWQMRGNNYSALTLNINSASAGYLSGNGTGAACVNYSVNNGRTWTNVRCDGALGWPQTTDTVALSARQDLTKLQVAICTEGDSGGGDVNFIGSDNVLLFDIWTSGTYSTGPAGTGSSAGQPHRGAVVKVADHTFSPAT